jgi:hypothetical protein
LNTVPTHHALKILPFLLVTYILNERLFTNSHPGAAAFTKHTLPVLTFWNLNACLDDMDL